MRALSACEILELRDLAAGAGPTGRALAILARVVAGPPEALAALPLGRRDALLLELYRGTFGPALDLFVRCPACEGGLELAVTADDLLAGRPVAGELDGGSFDPGALHQLATAEGLVLRFRLTTSADLEAAALAADPAAARAVLVERVVAEARRGGAAIAPGELGENELALLAESLAAADPLAEVVFDLECPSCGHAWQAACEIADCFWHQLDVASRQLLREIHVLARGYGWREADVLALAPPRRRLYLEMLALE